MARLSRLFAIAALLLGGCRTASPTHDFDKDKEPVVSPTDISNQHQEEDSLYLEDTEHWWEEQP